MPMVNPAFDAAMLLRGLRAMDAALGESYNVMSHTCIPSPVVYSSTFPENGIDFTKYKGGFEGVKGVWRGWMYEDGGNGNRKATVHEQVEETVVEAFDLFTKLDGNKDGKITKDEWEKKQKNRKADDQLFDLEYLTALQNVTAKMIDLEKGTPLNPADPNTYPELIQTRSELQTTQGELLSTQAELSLYQNVSYGLGTALGVVALALGLRAALRGRKKTEETPQPKTPATPPPLPTSTPTATPEEAAAAGAAAPAGPYDDVLGAFEGAGSPNKSVLEALAEAEKEAAPAPAQPAGGGTEGGEEPPPAAPIA